MPEKAVVFDMMGVLIKEAHVIRDLLAPLVKVDRETARDAYRLYQKADITRNEFWHTFNVKDIDETEAAFFEPIHLNDNAHEILGYFKQKYTLTILSDLAHDWMQHFLNTYKLAPYFSVIEYTGKTKLRKKETASFERLLSILKKEPQDVYHIDDRPTYIETANKVGINTVWYDNGQWPCEVCTSNYTIHSLLDLKKIL